MSLRSWVKVLIGGLMGKKILIHRCVMCGTVIKKRGVCSDKCDTQRNIKRWRAKGETCQPAGPVKINGEIKNNLGFYNCDDWLHLRYVILREHGFACLACGRGRKDGTTLHVDHIKPISKYPELRLDRNNLQVLCRECNLGKSNKYEDDLRLKNGI